MKRGSLVLAIAVSAASVASAAELPSRSVDAKQAEAKARKCEINGERGVELSNGVCMRLSGDMSAGVATGTLKH